MLRRDLKVDVQLTEGHYGEFTVLADEEALIDGGTLGFLGILPSIRDTIEEVRAALVGETEE